MSIEEFLSGFEAGKIGLSFNGLVNIEEAVSISEFLIDNGFAAWDGTPMLEYIETRFIDDSSYGYMTCDTEGKHDVTACGPDCTRCKAVVSWDVLDKLISRVDITTEDFESLLF